MMFKELLPDMLADSTRLILDFESLPKNISPSKDIRRYFEEYRRQGLNPRLPANRQRINNSILDSCKCRYLVSGYAENRKHMLADTSIAREGRTYHLGIDIFSKNLAPVLAPCDGEIVETGHEEGFGTFGHYAVFKPAQTSDHLFLGHLSNDLPHLGKYQSGDKIGTLGDYKNDENGGWSRHLHLQVMSDYQSGILPIGYSSQINLDINKCLYPDPMELYPKWKLV